MDTWGDDYSLLIHSIEGHLSEHIVASPTHDQSLLSNATTSGQKRRRLSTGSPLHVVQQDEDDQYLFAGRQSGYQNAESMKLTAQLDESRLLNERLKDKFNRVSEDFAKYKEKAMKQLQFMLTENDQLKKDAATQSDRYFDEKQKWQLSLRSAESEISKLSRKGTNFTPSPAAPIRSAPSTAPDLELKLIEIEKSVRSKSNEMKILSTANAELEERCGKLQQELILMKLRIGEQVQADDDVLDTRDFKKRCADLETSLRRKTREFERLEGKIQNQLLLEEELVTANMKLNLAKESIEKLKNVTTQYHALLDEKQEWSTLFRGIIAENDTLPLGLAFSELKNSGLQNSTQEISPAVALRTLGAIQKRYILLLKSQNEFETTNVELKKRAEKSEVDLASLGLEKDEAVFQAERTAAKLRVAQRQTKLFEGEVSSLRALISSFDVEFNLGRPLNDTLFQMKDRIISGLQSDLDQVRSEAKLFAEQVEDLEQKLLGQTKLTVSSGERGQSDSMQTSGEDKHLSQEALLKEELMALMAFTGVDYVPHKTKVLHLVDNPSSSAMGSRAQKSSLPKDVVNRLNTEIKAQRETDKEGDSVGSRRADDSSLPNATATPSPANTADSNKMNQRLKEMFKERITSFRECVYLLTGYKVDLYPADTAGGVARLRLRSMYSDDPEDSLLFQMRGDSLELIDSPFASKLDSKLFTYLSTCNSVPAFLSSVTLDLFDNQTFLG